ncbi:MAG: hypothetical protein WC282_00475 [Bacilli bacterium]|jgi:hypothetical protein
MIRKNKIMTAISIGAVLIMSALLVYTSAEANIFKSRALSGIPGLPAGCQYEEISTAAQLYALSANTDSAAMSKNYVLMNDIDLGAYQWEPIGYSAANDETGVIPFTGAFDGRGHTISNIKRDFGIAPNGWVRGFFGTIGAGGVVRNTTFVGRMQGNSWVGGLFATNNGIVEDCLIDINVYGPGGNAFCVGIHNNGITRNVVLLGKTETDGATSKGLFGTSSGTATGIYADADEVLTPNYTGAGTPVADDGTRIYSHANMMLASTYTALSTEKWTIADELYPVLKTLPTA